MSVTTPTLKLLGDVEPLDELDDDAAGALDELDDPPPPAELLELDELLLPHAASARVATTPTVHVPRRPILYLTTDSSQI
jgi:hypothetical protein